jgi:hypothetical protein
MLKVNKYLGSTETVIAVSRGIQSGVNETKIIKKVASDPMATARLEQIRVFVPTAVPPTFLYSSLALSF